MGRTVRANTSKTPPTPSAIWLTKPSATSTLDTENM